jgi:hypothetical protein
MFTMHDGFVGTLQGIEGDEEDVVGSDKVPTCTTTTTAREYTR